MAVMVKVLPFHDELAMPPLVKVKKEELIHGQNTAKTRGRSANNEVCPSVRVDRTRDRR